MATGGEAAEEIGVKFNSNFVDFDPNASFQLDVGDCNGHLGLPVLELFPYIDVETSQDLRICDQETLANGSTVQNNHGASSGSSTHVQIMDFDRWDLDHLEPLQPSSQDFQPANRNVHGEVIPRLQLQGFLESDTQEGIQKGVSDSFHHLMPIRKKVAERLESLNRQRLNHMRVERNRRKEMNHNIAILKHMLPPNQVTKNDQASVIAGAVDYIKALQQLHDTLKERKARKKILSPRSSLIINCPAVPSSLTTPEDGAPRAAAVVASSSAVQQVHGTHSAAGGLDKTDACEGCEINDCWAHVLITRAGKGVGVLIETRSRPSQLTELIVAVQSLYLDVLEMNVGRGAEKKLHVFFKTMIADGADCSDCRFSVKELAKTIHQSTISISYSPRTPH